MKKAILKVLLLYVIGFGIARLYYVIFGYSYIHAPGMHHLIMFLTLVIGIFWTLKSLVIYFFRTKKKELIGVIVSNFVAIIIIVMSVFVPDIFYSSEDESNKLKPDIFQTVKKGDSIRMYYKDELIYFKVKDTVILDLR